MSGYIKGEFSQEHDQQILEATRLLGEIKKRPEFSPFESLLYSYSLVSGSCVIKLVASHMSNNLASLGTEIKHKHLIDYIRGMKENEEGVKASITQRINALTEIFNFVHNNIDILDPVFYDFLDQLNEIEDRTSQNIPRIDKNIRARFCSAFSASLMQHIWDNLFYGLPDARVILDDSEMKKASESSKMRRDTVLNFLPAVLGRFLDGFLLSLVERFLEYECREDAYAICLDEQAICYAVVHGLYAVEQRIGWNTPS